VQAAEEGRGEEEEVCLRAEEELQVVDRAGVEDDLQEADEGVVEATEVEEAPDEIPPGEIQTHPEEADSLADEDSRNHRLVASQVRRVVDSEQETIGLEETIDLVETIGLVDETIVLVGEMTGLEEGDMVVAIVGSLEIAVPQAIMDPTTSEGSIEKKTQKETQTMKQNCSTRQTRCLLALTLIITTTYPPSFQEKLLHDRWKHGKTAHFPPR